MSEMTRDSGGGSPSGDGRGYWRSLQDAIAKGRVMDVFPYRRKKRFVRHAAARQS